MIKRLVGDLTTSLKRLFIKILILLFFKKHPEYLDEDYWKTADFTLFVYCPFDVSKGGVNGTNGAMTFPDFYDGEHSEERFTIVNFC